ncbi:hypothetical protein COS55_03625 [Candidatus Shapirobacteria bacterium CG03_land_8_20_14_0_80_40_19]|uniref:DUF6922 domain-containing protein n=4 Tax=Candidatus Shapironibacteriota TaxID=1752721 RepID=A0A2M7BBC0_9BACT|nr:MAG: hypothetical protein COV89_04375 [Candidatus Shapirobacteria bacterium CG11_big_fil_rev_8_21_14_0_20_40_12]PIV00397.1 MAG: hypothetical protein COS55_03625 [Candidatus Shapirobacteria bacterium CG03_land_8_20_14_0_80_40_19]PJC28825.1 MAG: hypothetical protein CO053_02625 [Candidatus Shapirobacteria bacterium CG_4_9_14_0_2_um_filter_40_11]PJC76744.1 MAG: hypothetical protein CO010_01955 [Candidatus Shapirobacteria bacterium CG_4_8_14_3_um_filter_39_11]
MKKVPKELQPFLWSVKTDQLDCQKDKIYIINQILAYGGLKEIKWLFKNYPLKVVRDVFLHHPIKTYRASTFNFVKEILLEVGNTLLVKEKYVVNTPRIIR